MLNLHRTGKADLVEVCISAEVRRSHAGSRRNDAMGQRMYRDREEDCLQK
jgi:hypothetical protein